MEKVGRAIEPDNLPNMDLLIDELCLRPAVLHRKARDPLHHYGCLFDEH